MHNGMLESLDDVLRFYNAGRSENPNVTSAGRNRNTRGTASIDPDFRRVPDMSDAQMADVVAFLEALTDDSFDRKIPERVPGGLTPGGR